jgi:uncharacterized protein RhaS with RHS repeats
VGSPGDPRPHAPTCLYGSANDTYDANGNRKSDHYCTYIYTVENNLAQVTGLGVVKNTFDGDGQRIVRDVSGITHYVGPNYEYNLTTQVATLYCPFNGRPVAMKQGTTVTYLVHDHLGSLVSVTDVTGQEVFAARYWPFGSLRTPPTT